MSSTNTYRENQLIVDTFVKEAERVYSRAYVAGFFSSLTVAMLNRLSESERNLIRGQLLNCIEEFKCKPSAK